MIKLLIKKQLRELFSSFTKKNNKDSENKKKSLVGYAFIFLFLCVSIVFMNTMLFIAICETFVSLNLGWAYFAMVFMAAAIIGIIGSVFTAYSAMYNAKDNELMLSMPIKPSAILISRLVTIYFLSFAFELVVIIPGTVVYLVHAGFDIAVLLMALFTGILLSLVVFALTMALGYVVAIVASRFKYKSFAITVLAVAGFVGYYLLCFNMSDILMGLIQKAAVIGVAMQRTWNLFYHMGQAVFGNVISILITTAIAVLLFGICYVLVARSFLRIVTTKKSLSGKSYVERKQKSASSLGALIRREFCHLFKVPNYFLNCCMSAIFTVMLAVVLIIKSGDIIAMLDTFGFAFDVDRFKAVAIAATVSFVSSMDLFSASCISIEGNKHLWLLKSVPVHTMNILGSKLIVHMIISFVPGIILEMAMILLLKIPVVESILAIAAFLGATSILAFFGLVIGLKYPKLDWTNEIVAIKQNVSVLAAMFGGAIIILALFVPYFFIGGVSSICYLSIVCVVSLGGAFGLYRLIRGWGVRRFESL